MTFKLQHWMLEVTYLPGHENTLADALSREERKETETPVSMILDVSLARGDVEEQTPHERRAESENSTGSTT